MLSFAVTAGAKEITIGVAGALFVVGLICFFRKETRWQALGTALITGAAVTLGSLFVQLHATELSEKEAERSAIRMQIALARDLRGFDFREIASTLESERSNVYLSGKRLRNTTFTGLDLRKWDFRDADLTGAVLDDVKLHNVDLINAKLTGASLKGAELIGARLQDAELNGTIASATFTGAGVNEQTCWPEPDGDDKLVRFRAGGHMAELKPERQTINDSERLVYGHFCRTRTLIVSDPDGTNHQVLTDYCIKPDDCTAPAPTPTPVPVTDVTPTPTPDATAVATAVP